VRAGADIAPMASIKKQTQLKRIVMDIQRLKYKVAIYSKYHRVDIRYP
jgi:hypothetical protein